MNWGGKKVTLVALWLVSIAAANFLGGVVGFRQGFATSSVLFGNDVVPTLAALRLLRSGKSQEAIRSLEVQLDAQTAAHVFGTHAYHSPYNLLMRSTFGDRPVKADACALSWVLKYRQEYPPVSPDAALNAKVMKALEAFRDAPAP